jgi:hypothetical protein
MKLFLMSLVAGSIVGCMPKNQGIGSDELKASKLKNKEGTLVVCKNISSKESGEKIEEEATLVRKNDAGKGELFVLTYKYNVKKGLKTVNFGEQVIKGSLDPDFNHAIDKDKIYFLLSGAIMTSQYRINDVPTASLNNLDKTEFLLKDNNRLIIEEKEIILDLKGCKRI